LKVTRSALSFILTTAKIIVKTPRATGALLFTQQKDATAGIGGAVTASLCTRETFREVKHAAKPGY
jgi:hypothetical protein